MITLATLKDATAQQVFDQVKNHLLKQYARSVGPEGCAYRACWDGQKLMCAAGCLISDEEYAERGSFIMDGSNNTSWDYHVEKGRVPKEHFDLIKSLQTIHDQDDPSEWSAQLKELAAYHGLVYEGVTE